MIKLVKPAVGHLLFFLVTFVLPNTLKAQKENPVGTIWLRDNVYIDATPVLNVHYREYLHFMRTFVNFHLDSLLQRADAAPYFRYDTGNFLAKHAFANADSNRYKINEMSAVTWNWMDYKTYLNDSRYNFYPLVNISRELAEEFCRWRTAMVQLVYATSFSKEERDKFHKKIRYRLATEEEWEYALKKFGSEKNICIVKPKRGEVLPTLERKHTNSNETRCYTLANLSEIISGKAVVKGCNWKQNDCKDNKTTSDTNAPADWITFRCVCEVED